MFDEIIWWENDGDQDFTEHTIAGDFDWACAVYATDIDGDGDIDILGAAGIADDITWWESDLNPWDNPPEDFSLLSPDDEAEINGFPLWLAWENTTDPTPDDSVRFTVYISPDSTFEDILVTECINAVTDTSVEIIHLTDSTTYWWKVLAEDLMGNQTWSIETWSFTFNWDDPGDELSSRRSFSKDGWREIPIEFGIVSIYPNPFNSNLTAVIALPDQSNLQVSIYNSVGQRILSLADGQFPPGYQLFSLNGDRLASGIYFVRVNVPGRMNEVRKVVLIR
jgi:hypothetical protein